MRSLSAGTLALLFAATGLQLDAQSLCAQAGPVIVWNDGYAVMVDRGDSAGPQVLTGGDYPSLSPDRRWVAFSRSDGLYIIGVDGLDQPFEPDVPGLVTWSPDGREVAVRNRADGGLYAVAVDGSSVRQVAWHFAPFAYPASAVEGTSWGAAKQSVRP